MEFVRVVVVRMSGVRWVRVVGRGCCMFEDSLCERREEISYLSSLL